jgi:hypothetical protein
VRDGLLLDTCVAAVHGSTELGVDDIEPRDDEHRLEQPPEGAVFGPDVFGEVFACVPQGRVVGRAVEPVGDHRFGLGRLEVKDQIAEAKDASCLQHPSDAVEPDRLPEIGELMQGVRVYTAPTGGPLCSYVRNPASTHSIFVSRAYVIWLRRWSSIREDTSTATTRRQMGAALSASRPVPAPKSNNGGVEQPARWTNPGRARHSSAEVETQGARPLLPCFRAHSYVVGFNTRELLAPVSVPIGVQPVGI